MAIIAGSVWLAGETQRSASNRAGTESYLAPHTAGSASFEVALASAREGAGDGEADELRTIAEQERAARRADDRELQTEVDEERERNQRQASWVSVGLIVVLSGLFGALGYFFVERGARADVRRRERQAHFADVMQLARNEAEAHGVAKRHPESTVPDARVVVLNRNNSADGSSRRARSPRIRPSGRRCRTPSPSPA